jgi:uncharacterized protein YbjT (DUF2867 family)
MIALMGAAGNVGSKVADLLLGRGEEIRVLEHGRSLQALEERGAEVVKGDARSVETLRELFAGAGAAFVLLPDDLADPQFVATRSAISRALATALAERSVGHVVALSAVGADREDMTGPPAGLREYERRLSALEDVDVLVLRPASYMDYLLMNIPLIQARHINGSAIDGDRRFPMVATLDVAREAAERLARRDFSGHGVKLLLGPEDVSMREATAALGARLGLPELPYVEFPPDDMRAALVGAGMSDEAASLVVDMQLGLNAGRPFDTVRRTASSTTPTRLEEFLNGALAGAPNEGGGSR